MEGKKEENLAVEVAHSTPLIKSWKPGRKLGDMEQRGLPIARFSAIARSGNSCNLSK